MKRRFCPLFENCFQKRGNIAVRATSACSRCRPIPCIIQGCARTLKKPKNRLICPEVIQKDLPYLDMSYLESSENSSWDTEALFRRPCYIGPRVSGFEIDKFEKGTNVLWRLVDASYQLMSNSGKLYQCEVGLIMWASRLTRLWN